MNKEEIKILIADDEPDILNFLRYNLEKEGYWVYSATNGNDALTIALKVVPDLIILDVMMPGKDGIETCKILRQLPSLNKVPVAFLTAMSEAESEQTCLRAGANDYITKPVRPKLLLNRIELLLSKSLNTPATLFKIGNLEVDLEKYVVITDKKKLDLPKKEFELLSLLISKPGKTYRREEIKNSVWKNEHMADDRTIDVHIYKLREKIGEQYIKTIKGIGYRLDY